MSSTTEDGPTRRRASSLKRLQPTHEALSAAERVASEQQTPGETSPIEYEDAKGNWHEEVARGNDRPSTEVCDDGSHSVDLSDNKEPLPGWQGFA